MTKPHIYETGLGKTPANFEALTPLSFLARAARVYPDYPALIHAKPLPAPAGSAPALRYLRDRISVPRDMPLHAARRLQRTLPAMSRIRRIKQHHIIRPRLRHHIQQRRAGLGHITRLNRAGLRGDHCAFACIGICCQRQIGG